MRSLVLGPLNYLFVHSFGTGKYCLGVFDNRGQGTLVGGISVRNVLVQVSLAPCTWLIVHSQACFCSQARTDCAMLAFMLFLEPKQGSPSSCVQYDRRNDRIGFAPAQCAALGRSSRPPCSRFTDPTNFAAATAAASDGDCQIVVPPHNMQQQVSTAQHGH